VHCRKLLSYLCLCPVALAVAAASAQTPTETQTPAATQAPAAPDVTVLSISDVESRIARVEQDATLTEQVKSRLLEVYRQALDDLKRADSWIAKKAEFDNAREQTPATLSSIKEQLAQPVKGATPDLPTDATLQQVEQMFAQADADLKSARSAATALDDERKRRTDRRAELPGLITATRLTLDETSREFAALAPSEDNQELALAQRTAVLAKRAVLLAEAEAYEAEVLSYDARGELLTARRDLAARTASQAETIVKFWQDAVNTRRRDEADKAAKEAKAARKAAASSNPALKPLAEENAAWAERRTKERLPDRIEQATQLQDEITKTMTKIANDFASVTAKIRAAGLSHTMGLLLRRQRDTLPNIREHQDAVERRRFEVSTVQVALIELEDARSSVTTDADTLVQEVAERIDPSKTEEERKEILDLAQELLQLRRNYIDSLISDYNSYFVKLVDVDSAERRLIDKIEEFNAYIDERILWIESASLPRVEDIGHGVEAVAWLVHPENWRNAAVTLWSAVRAKPVPVAFFLPLFLALAVSRPRIWRHTRGLGERAAKPYAREFGVTAQAVVLTGLVTLLLPAIPWSIGWALSSHTGASVFSLALGHGLRAAAAALLTVRLLRYVCRPDGLGEAHFSWPAQVTRRLRRHLSWLAIFGVPIALVVSVFENADNEAWGNSLGRLSFIAGQLLLVVFAQCILLPKSGIFAQVTTAASGWTRRFRIGWYLLGTGLPALLGVLALIGYYYTALRLTVGLFQSAWLVIGLVLANAVTLRWVLINHRKISIEEYRKRRAAAKATESGQEPPAEPEIDLSSISTQVHNLLRTVAVFLLLIGLWVVWNDVLPALRVFDRVQLWSVMEHVAVSAADAQDEAAVRWVDRPRPVTLQDLGVALVIFAITLIASRNLPGLLEMLLLQRLRLQAGERYAITSVSRHAVVGVGIVLGRGAIGLGWAKVQWLAAAVTVGLGFGLQEIFANFVSGIIILFERPIRIGDVVTVGEVEGTVTRIRIRATTITDWNMRELIVPNKEFITGRLINWTLSDPTTRLVIPVGIAYGSNTQLATDLLLKIAREHDDVLAHPAPNVVFRAFGSSSLDFELRVYIATRDVWPRLTHSLHMTIDQEFRKAGIEIAFPQQDLHIRSIDVPLRVDDGRERD